MLTTEQTQPIKSIDINAYNRNERFAAEFFGVDIETVRGWRRRGSSPGLALLIGESAGN